MFEGNREKMDSKELEHENMLQCPRKPKAKVSYFRLYQISYTYLKYMYVKVIDMTSYFAIGVLKYIWLFVGYL